MRLKSVSTKTLLGIVGSVPALASIGYFGHSYLQKQNFFSRRDVIREQAIDYIDLDDNLYANLSYELPDETIHLAEDKSSKTHLKLLGIARTRRDPVITDLAIAGLVNTHFNDYQLCEIAQSCDFQTAVRLARTPGVSPKLFLPPIDTRLTKLIINSNPLTNFNEVFHRLLSSARKSGDECSECTKYFTQLSIDMLDTGTHSRLIHDPIDFNDIHSVTRNKFTKFPAVEWLYLQSIYQNILCGESQCKSLADNGLFLILHHLRCNYPEIEIHDWIAQTLANLSAHRVTHSHFWSSRWMSTLVQWFHSDRIEWSLPAAKILHNLSDESNYLLPESIYLLHPTHRGKSNLDVDIVLVHGLLGGTFKTWRQNDMQKDSDDYTRCWPQKWLTQDIDNLRILAVNYKTFLSNWNIECHDSNSIFTLQQRSRQLMNELKASRIGERPIVWITHSLGGLLVKQMLVDIEESDDPTLKPILNQTKGMVFYSVPHKGSDIAVRSPYLQRVLSPSTEVLTLRKDSSTLQSLHNRFVNLMSNQSIDCLSFGETLKSTVIKRPFKWRQLLVPEDSADPGVGEFHLLTVDHFNTCKPVHKTSESYLKTLEFIRRIVNTKIPPKSGDDREDNKLQIILSSVFD